MRVTRLCVAALATVGLGIQVRAETVIPYPINTQTWTAAGSPYVLAGPNPGWIPAGETLTIEPGVDVLFDFAGDAFWIDGKMEAVGTVSDSIRFLPRAVPEWLGLRFRASPDSSTLAYVRVSGSKGHSVSAPGR